MGDPPATMALRAISFAARKHFGQYRRDGKTPYAAHPMRVFAVMSTLFRVQEPEVLAAAVLHDTIEDTTTDWDDLNEQFGERVATYVALLSKDARLPEEEQERHYMESLAAAPVEVKICKLADVYDNLLDCQDLSASARARSVRKAERVVNLLADTLPDHWSHVLRHVREQLRALTSTP